MSSTPRDTVRAIDSVVVDVCQLIPDPSLETVFASFKSVAQTIDEIKAHRSQAKSLADLIARVLLAVNNKVEESSGGQTQDPTIISTIEELEECVIIRRLPDFD